MSSIFSSGSFLQRLEWGGILLVLSLPLLSIDPIFSPPSFVKGAIFQIIVSFLLLTIVWHAIKENRNLHLRKIYFKKNHPLFWPLFFFMGWIAVLTLTSITSLDPFQSFLGNPNRGWGVLTILFFVAFVFILFLKAGSKEWKMVWIANLTVATIVAFLGILQTVHWSDAVQSAIRPYASIGNSGLLAAYLLLAWFPGLFLAVEEPSFKKKILYSTSLVTLLITIALTLTRAVFIGFGVGIILFLILYPRQKQWVKKLALVLFLGGIGVIILTNSAFTTQFLATIPFLDSMANRLSIERAFESSRLSVWDNALQAIKERPLLGYGPYNSSIAFDRTYDPNDSYLQGTKWWDTFHNIFLDTAVNIGIIGFTLWGAFLFVLIAQLQKVKRLLPEKALKAHAVQTTFISYLVTMSFSFNVFSTHLLFFLLIAYSFSLISHIPHTPPK